MKKTDVLAGYLSRLACIVSFVFFYSCDTKELMTPENGSRTTLKTASTGSAGGQKQHDFSDNAGGTRSYYISVPEDYTEEKKYRLVFVFAGTDTTGEEMHQWMGMGWNTGTPGLEQLMDNTIFVYPDQKYMWGNVKGWALGNYAAPYNGLHDIQFTKELLTLIKQEYSIDADRIFATGHSWGGDMTNVTAYFLKGAFKAIAPVASNRPFWFENNNSYIDIPEANAKTAIWIFFGLQDDHFGNSSLDGDFGIQQAEFWISKNGGNSGQPVSNPIGSNGDTTKTYSSIPEVKLTLYSSGQYSGGGSLPGHQPPDYYFKAVTDWLKTF